MSGRENAVGEDIAKLKIAMLVHKRIPFIMAQVDYLCESKERNFFKEANFEYRYMCSGSPERI